VKPTDAAKRRCAVYTRKSSDEGLEQGFNSLHAQREACEAYIASQAGEGWVLVKTEYDDGGFSGGTMDRPALKRLLGDVERGLVDTIVVYKVDRLTRSLHDFARIVDVFDKVGASFVSITQAFNTTTSMGRLTLNVLLSFAQFEREVTGERIRDKIAQSKAKGMWMGGTLPLGYDGGDHMLVVNPAEAQTVEMIFRRYLELGSVYALEAELLSSGVKSKAWFSRSGKIMGGVVFSRGALYYLLQNLHYRGLIRHKNQTFPGRHPAIIEAELFDAVQAQLASHRVERRDKLRAAKPAALTGLIFDAAGAPYTPTFSTGRGGKTYRYYIARSGAATTLSRLPAAPLEAFVADLVRRIAGRSDLGQEDAIAGRVRRVEVRPAGVQLVLGASEIFGADHPDLALEDLRARLHLGERAVMDLRGEAVRISLPVRMRFRGGETWISGAEPTPGVRRLKPSATLVRALREAHAVVDKLGASALTPQARTMAPLAPSKSYLSRLAKLAFLAPDIQLDILAGRQPQGMLLKPILRGDVPLGWDDQRTWIKALARHQTDRDEGAGRRDLQTGLRGTQPGWYPASEPGKRTGDGCVSNDAPS
jgi:site-specific DNA recombinase